MSWPKKTYKDLVLWITRWTIAGSQYLYRQSSATYETAKMGPWISINTLDIRHGHSDSEPLEVGMLVIGHSLTRLLAPSLAPLTRSLASHCSLRSSVPLRSLTHSLLNSWDSGIFQFSRCPESLCYSTIFTMKVRQSQRSKVIVPFTWNRQREI